MTRRDFLRRAVGAVVAAAIPVAVTKPGLPRIGEAYFKPGFQGMPLSEVQRMIDSGRITTIQWTNAGSYTLAPPRGF